MNFRLCMFWPVKLHFLTMPIEDCCGLPIFFWIIKSEVLVFLDLISEVLVFLAQRLNLIVIGMTNFLKLVENNF